MTTVPRDGVSFVLPVHNGAETLDAVLHAVFGAVEGEAPIEVIAVDDQSRDTSAEILRRVATKRPLRIVEGEGRGAAAALNTGIRLARYPLIAQLDQDVVIDKGWLRRLVAALDDLGVAAAQGQYVVDGRASLIGRAMALDLAQRYEAIGTTTSHVCTGNSLYRATALHQVGLFDETLGYGYDNDLSYRLIAAGYRLTFCRDAHSTHRWRDTLTGYLAQQYGFGYGRLDVVAKHPARMSGDTVSPAAMMSHGAIMTVAILGLVVACGAMLVGMDWRLPANAALALLSLLAIDRAWASALALARFRDPAALLFVPLHLLRDLAWVVAIVVWGLRRVTRSAGDPAHSMGAARRGAVKRSSASWSTTPNQVARVLGVIPAYNEAANLKAVVAEVRRHQPELDVLVIDDGSTDQSAALLPLLNVRWLSFPERLGVGSAMRAGIRYASRAGYDACVRIDGDGQHAATDIESLVSPLRDGRSDVVLGSRYASGRSGPKVGVLQRALGRCLSLLTNSRVTDPTSGFYALGPRALRLLAEHHPTGYPEPELRLFLSRNQLHTIEVPVLARPRLGGTTSLTLARVLTATARVFLAMVIVPLRRQVGERQ
jgi:glycosyltransferase involved in cell wall biosynthesis